MQNNFYFLRQLSKHLEQRLLGASLVECYTQSKGELLLGFALQNKEDLFLKGTFQPDFTCLSFPPQQHRARRNSVNLFEEVTGQSVLGLTQYEHDRSFSINFSNGYTLLFKMHGNRANVVLIYDQQPQSLFKNKLAKDWSIIPNQLHRHPAGGFDRFVASNGDPKKLFPALGQEPILYLKDQAWESMDLEQQWQLLQKVEQQLLQADTFYVCTLEGKPQLLLFELGITLFSSKDPLAALNFFYRTYTYDWALDKERSAMLHLLDRQIRSTESYLYKTMEKLEELQSSASHRHMADLIMANLHRIPQGTEKIELDDFYSSGQITVKLKRELSPQKNAETYYRKAKNQQREITQLQENVSAKEDRLNQLTALRQQTVTEEDLKKLRALRKEQLPEDDQQPTFPFRQFEFQQYQILVGKGATQNDELLRHHSRKDDLWLHAKDVTGSHVIIKRIAGKPVPAPVKEKAAQLAAWYSKRKSDSLCPVICTPRKWVRKIKGAPAGAVMVDKEEEVLLVEPKAYE